LQNKRTHDQVEPESEQGFKRQRNDINTLFQLCPSCHNNLQRPLTLPCGYTCCTPCHKSNLVCIACHRMHTTAISPNVTIQTIQTVLGKPGMTMNLKSKLAQSLECAICCTRFTQPTTTPCGHTFCRNYDEESADALDLDLEHDTRVPLLVGSLAFPGVNCMIHVFEPRYRLMLRRVMQSKRSRFGLCLVRRKRSDRESPFYEYGTMLELMQVQTLPDGRSIVEAVGSHRFRVTSFQLQDGYHMAEIERIDDLDREQQQAVEQEQILRASALRAKCQQQRLANASLPQSIQPPPLLSGSPMMQMINQRRSWAQQAHPQTSQVNRAPWLQMHVRGLSATRSKPYQIQQQQPQQRLLHQPQLANIIPTVTKQQQATPHQNRQEVATDELVDELVTFIQKLIQYKQSHPNTHWFGALGNPPSLDKSSIDRVKLVWWFINLAPLGEEEKVSLLATRTLRERVLTVMSWIDKFEDQWSLFLDNRMPLQSSSSSDIACCIS
ncbi:hypothetical protein BCV72DRAFT_215821, partial [Rhizopus microsporus var. microsporus]